jgi:hypothetical protein
MARRRRPPVEGPPAELVGVPGDDWISDDGVPPLRGGIRPGLSGRRRIRTISVWVAMCLDLLRERAAYRRGCCRDAYSVDGFRPSRLCSVVRLEDFSPDDFAFSVSSV